MVDAMIKTVGTTGTEKRKLGFIIGPISFDHTDTQIKQMINDAAEIAIEKNVAVGFHIDDSMMWARRSDLMTPENIEWTDWDGARSVGMYLDWGAPKKIAPRMCLNSPGIQKAVTHQAKEVIGPALQAAVDKLTKAGKQDLFAGVIVGWETHMGQDYGTKDHVGYCALANRGFSKEKQPKDVAKETSSIVQEFIDVWAKGMVDAGIDRNKIYSHVAFVPEKKFKSLQETYPQLKNVPYSFLLNFGPSSADPNVALGHYYRPGFSTYPTAGLFDQIQEVVGSSPWASSEGTNIIPEAGAYAGNSGMSMETYLARMYNHGATLVTLFGFGIGGEEAKTKNPFRVTTENEESLQAYRKFLQ